MKLSCLGLSPQSSCYLLEYKNVKILLDCGMEISSILNYLPYSLKTNQFKNNNQQQQHNNDSKKEIPVIFKEINNNLYIDSNDIRYSTILGENLVDFETIDYILISNYQNIYSLPFITEYTKFKGRIYATEPTVQIGKLLLDELYQMNIKQSRLKNYNNNNNNNILQSSEILEKLYNHNMNNNNENFDEILKFSKWKELYNRLDIEKSFEKIISVRFSEIITVVQGFKMVPTSSGFTLGSCNWLIDNEHGDKIVYLSDSSLALSRYPLPMDIESLENPQLLIMTKLNYHPQLQPDEKLNELCSQIGLTCQQGGTSLIPVNSCGIVLDLFEHIAEYLTRLGLFQVPIYFISPVGKSVLAYADLYSEWLNKTKQERSQMPEPPFLHQDIIRRGQFQLIHQIHSNFQPTDGPSIQFVGHPSLRLGDVLQLLSKYSDQSKNSLFLIEPEFDNNRLLSPFQNPPLQCRIHYLPIDPRINFSDANLLISKLSPKNLIIPINYKNYIKNHINENSNILTTITPIQSMEIIKISIKQKFDRAHLDKSIAKYIKLNRIENKLNSIENINICEINGQLSLKDNQFIISSSNYNNNNNNQNNNNNIKLNYIFNNNFSIENLIESLELNGFKNLQISNNNNYLIIKIIHDNEEISIITIYNNENIKIETSKETIRNQLTNLILKFCIHNLS
ncbi:integrator complex subunit 9 [Tieghemostelium lacteum]|uniref:Integrator complex subunit 9 n=1 Tax=Tieghemostelium lacteum TaxID=361077 RepID=A0A151Z2I5_TIELA|nr:integrator complex subunit 9 [Tieghemostelium lacteum]|eukprot:KYQ88165.1 integrator complex subunit 9 [Tieghemostelium lacteum]